jgi:hypothetical protein
VATQPKVLEEVVKVRDNAMAVDEQPTAAAHTFVPLHKYKNKKRMQRRHAYSRNGVRPKPQCLRHSCSKNRSLLVLRH